MWLTKKDSSVPAVDNKHKKASRSNSIKEDVVVAIDGDEVLS